jgi:hypothetical protein
LEWEEIEGIPLSDGDGDFMEEWTGFLLECSQENCGGKLKS